MSVPIELLGEVVLAGLVVGGLAALVVGRAGTDPGTTVDAGDDGLPDGPLTAADLPRLRFGLAPRGYRMAEVDAFVDRIAGELERRDALLTELGVDPATAPRETTDAAQPSLWTPRPEPEPEATDADPVLDAFSDPTA
jgi:DivIVA domain-containing protein